MSRIAHSRRLRAVAKSSPQRRLPRLRSRRGVRIVADSGLSRVAIQPDVGLTRLETVRVSAPPPTSAACAGRTEPGVCYRLWDEPRQARGLTRGPRFYRRIFHRLCSISHIGALRSAKLAFRIRSQAALAEARVLLKRSGPSMPPAHYGQGRKLRSFAAAASGAHGGRRQLRREWCVGCNHCCGVDRTRTGGDDVDLRHRIEIFVAIARPCRRCARNRKRWAESAGADRNNGEHSAGRCLRWPIRIASPKIGALAVHFSCQWLRRYGRSGVTTSREPFLAVAELTGTAAASRIVAAPIEVTEIEARFVGQIEDRSEVSFDTASHAGRAASSGWVRCAVGQTRPVLPDSGARLRKASQDSALANC